MYFYHFEEHYSIWSFLAAMLGWTGKQLDSSNEIDECGDGYQVGSSAEAWSGRNPDWRKGFGLEKSQRTRKYLWGNRRGEAQSVNSKQSFLLGGSGGNLAMYHTRRVNQLASACRTGSRFELEDDEDQWGTPCGCQQTHSPVHSHRILTGSLFDKYFWMFHSLHLKLK